MGSRVIHYCVGNEIMKRLKFDENQFMLGNLAPDAYNPDCGGSLLSHFRIPEEIMEYECVDLDKFKSKYESLMFNSFVLGYYCHLITDNMWLKDAYRKYGHLGPDDRGAAVKLVYKDYWLLNTMLIDKFKLELLDFKSTIDFPIDEIEINYLNSLVESLRNDFNKRSDSEELIELDFDEILQFIEDATNECVRDICVLRDRNIILG